MRLSRSMPSAEVNSVMISPQPPRLRMKRRNTVSVMPDMGASNVAGAIRTPPRETEFGTRPTVPSRAGACPEPAEGAPAPQGLTGVSQYLRTELSYQDLCGGGRPAVGPGEARLTSCARPHRRGLLCPSGLPGASNLEPTAITKKPPVSQRPLTCVNPRNSLVKKKLFLASGGGHVGVLAAEAFHTSGGVQQLLLAGKEGVAGGADFHVDVAPVGGAGGKGVTAGAMHADFVIIGMGGGFHNSPDAFRERKILQEGCGGGQMGRLGARPPPLRAAS